MDWQLDKVNGEADQGQPSLLQMVQKALELLSRDNKHGFFLLIEGSRIDMANHLNDAGAMVSEAIMYDLVVDYVKKWVQNRDNGDTTLLSVADHETGGLGIGRTPHDGDYPPYEWYPDVLLAQKASAEWMAAAMLDQNQPPEQVMQQYAGFSLLPSELALIEAAIAREKNVSQPTLMPLSNTIGNIIAYRAGLGFTTRGHTAVDVNMYAMGYRSDSFRHNMKNMDVGGALATIQNLDLAAVTKSLENFDPVDPNWQPTKRLLSPRYFVHD